MTATEQKSGSDTAPDGRYCSASALDEVPPAIGSEIAGVNGNQFKASTAKQVINPPAKELYLPLYFGKSDRRKARAARSEVD